MSEHVSELMSEQMAEQLSEHCVSARARQHLSGYVYHYICSALIQIASQGDRSL